MVINSWHLNTTDMHLKMLHLFYSIFLFLHFRLSISGFSIQVFRLTLLTAKQIYIKQNVKKKKGRKKRLKAWQNLVVFLVKMSEVNVNIGHNTKLIYAHFGEHWQDGWLFPTVSCNSGTGWRLYKEKQEYILYIHHCVKPLIWGSSPSLNVPIT